MTSTATNTRPVLYLAFSYDADYERALDWFRGSSSFYADDENDEFRTVVFQVEPEEVAELERELERELTAQGFQAFQFEFLA